LALLMSVVPAWGADFEGTLWFTTKTPGPGPANVYKMDFGYNSHTPVTLSGLTPLANITNVGADGLVFTEDGFLAVGGQTNRVYKLNPNILNPPPLNFQLTDGPQAAYMMVAPDRTIYTSGLSLPATPVAFNSTLSTGGTARNVTGSETGISTLAWHTSASNTGFYTNGDVNGVGNFGTFTLSGTTINTTRISTGLIGARTVIFDPRTGDLILAGDGHVRQFDPNTMTFVSDLDLTGQGFLFDQSAVDGEGHLFVADNNGSILFVDYSTTGLVGAPEGPSGNFRQKLTFPGVDLPFDDLAPMVGPGSLPPPPVPAEPGSFVLFGIGGLVLLGYGWRRRQRMA
jgi:hypothetical protein